MLGNWFKREEALAVSYVAIPQCGAISNSDFRAHRYHQICAN